MLSSSCAQIGLQLLCLFDCNAHRPYVSPRVPPLIREDTVSPKSKTLNSRVPIRPNKNVQHFVLIFFHIFLRVLSYFLSDFFREIEKRHSNDPECRRELEYRLSLFDVVLVFRQTQFQIHIDIVHSGRAEIFLLDDLPFYFIQ